MGGTERFRQETEEAAATGEKAAAGPRGGMHLTGAGYSLAGGLGQSAMKGVNHI